MLFMHPIPLFVPMLLLLHLVLLEVMLLTAFLVVMGRYCLLLVVTEHL